jgi:hypothetical protein
VKNFSRILIGLAVISLVAGCGSYRYGVAKYPPKDDMFITEATEAGLTKAMIKKSGKIETTYTMLALIHTQRQVCVPCGATMDVAYRELEASMQKDLVTQAKKLGADAIIEMEWSMFPVAKMTQERKAAPVVAPCADGGGGGGGAQQKETWLVIELKGIAVKTCKTGPACK